MRLLPLLAALCLAAAPGAAWASRAEAWVSASARHGVGSRARPFPTVAEALASGARTLHLAKGRYEESVTLEPGRRLLAERGAVLAGETGQPALVAHGGVVRGLTVRSTGAVAVEISGEVRFENVRLEVSDGGGAHVRRGGLTWTQGEVLARSAGETGITLEPGTRLRGTHLVVRGPFHVGIAVEGADLSLAEGSLIGPAIGIRLRGESARLRRVRISDGEDVGLFVGKGSLEATDLTVSAHEYGVLAGRGSDVTLRSPQLSRNRKAGLATSGGRLEVRGGEISQSGPFGGMELSNTRSEIRGTRVTDSLGEGIAIVGGEATLRSVTVDGVKDPAGAEGEGILVRRGKVHLVDVAVSHTEGLGLYAAEASTVLLEGLRLSGWGDTAVASEAGSEIRGTSLRLEGTRSPQLVATRTGRIHLDRLVLVPPATLSVHCEADAPIQIDHLVGPAPSDPDCLRTSPGH